MKKLIILTITLASTISFAEDYIYALKNYARPSKGCIPVGQVSLSQANSLMRSQNLTTQNATSIEKRTIGAGLKRIQELNDGVLKSGLWEGRNPFPFRFIDNPTSSSVQRTGYIQINRKSSKRGKHRHYGLSVAQHVHEYAHFIGNKNGRAAYRSYTNHMKRAGEGLCRISNYAMRKRKGLYNEQFAEVFTAFVTEPRALLRNKRTPKACRAAFEFFEDWFDAGKRVHDCI